jgi:hypothetical protein
MRSFWANADVDNMWDDNLESRQDDGDYLQFIKEGRDKSQDMHWAKVHAGDLSAHLLTPITSIWGLVLNKSF